MFLDTLLDKVVIFEADADEYGRKFYFDYTKHRHRSPDRHPIQTKPVIFYLGKWPRKLKSGETRNFWCGIALQYLDDEQMAALKTHAAEILKKKRLKDRYWAGRQLLPDVFRRFYRTYRADQIENVIKGRIFTLKVTDADREEAKLLANSDGAEFDKLPEREQGQYLEKAIVRRGESDMKAQDEAAKDREQEERDDEMPAPEPQLKPQVNKPGPKTPPKPVQPSAPPTTSPESMDIMPSPEPQRPSKFKPVSRMLVPPPEIQPAAPPPGSIRGNKHGMIKPDPKNIRQRSDKQKPDEIGPS